MRPHPCSGEMRPGKPEFAARWRSDIRRRAPAGSAGLAALALLCLLACCLGCSAGNEQSRLLRSNQSQPLDSRFYTQVRDSLYAHYRGWRSVDYRYGGLSKDGVDCSGFVHLAYLRRFDVPIPRTTEGLLRFGPEVPRAQLRPGDLVFFDTGWSSVHVGIYLDRDRFLHASKSQGVTISNLRSSYWSSKHFRSVRILPGASAAK